MRLGTRSVLFGAHSPLIHPWFVARAWRRLYGFPWDPRLWVAFVVHDLGYWGKPNLDGPEGTTHPELGARIMRRLFGSEWGDFCLLHSRHYARQLNRPTSPLCRADKLALALTPSWLYLLLIRLSGEVWEYLETAKAAGFADATVESWYPRIVEHFSRIATEEQPSVWQGADRNI